MQGRELLVSVLAVPAGAAAAWVAPSWQADTSTKLVLCFCAACGPLLQSVRCVWRSFAGGSPSAAYTGAGW